MKLFGKSMPIPVICMTGEIKKDRGNKPAINYETYRAPLQKAFKAADKDGCVAIVISSPGGSPQQSELLGSQIRSLADKYEVPVYSFIEDYAASGGYWLACAGDEIYALNTSIVGSIGVIGGFPNFHELMKRHGVEFVQLKAGENKAPLSPFLKIDKDAVEKMEAQMLSPIHKQFQKWVQNRRGDRLPIDTKEIFSARTWIGANALDEKTGLIDGIGSLYEVLGKKFSDVSYELKDFTPKPARVGLLKQLIGDKQPKPSREEALASAIVGETLDRLRVPLNVFDIR